MMRNPHTWRWSPERNHTDTITVGRHPEVAVMRPPNFARLVANLFGLVDAWTAMGRMLLNAAGCLHPEETTFVAAAEEYKVLRVARIWVVIYAGVIALAVATGSILPLMVVGLPRSYGASHTGMTGLLQHGGLAENVNDHRLNSRMVYMNPISLFIYWNMNYHVDHHMFPMVPYHQLPALHDKIRHDLPAPNSSIPQALAEMLPVLWRQLRNEAYYQKRELPPTARPSRED
jgi:fatty acid desaturase